MRTESHHDELNNSGDFLDHLGTSINPTLTSAEDGLTAAQAKAHWDQQMRQVDREINKLTRSHMSKKNTLFYAQQFGNGNSVENIRSKLNKSQSTKKFNLKATAEPKFAQNSLFSNGDDSILNRHSSFDNFKGGSTST